MIQKPQYLEVEYALPDVGRMCPVWIFIIEKVIADGFAAIRCGSCGKHFSDRPSVFCYRQKKRSSILRSLNFFVPEFLSGERRFICRSIEKTIVRKFCQMGEIAVEGLPFFSLGQDPVDPFS